MRSELLLYDEKGFAPSRKIRTLDEYLRESEAKLEMLCHFEKDPHRFIYEHLGIDDDFEIARPNDEWSERFYSLFETQPLCGISTSPKTFRRMLRRSSFAGKAKSFFDCLRFLGGFTGTILEFKDSETSLFLPLVKECTSHKDDFQNFMLYHETIHCARRQWGTFVGDLKYGSTEEAVAYIYKYKDNSSDIDLIKPMLRIFPSVYDAVTLAIPTIACYFILRNGALIAFGGAVARSVYYGNKTASFFKRCEEEGLNPFYLFLRSNPSEYSKERPIADQICERDEVRFKIMAYRLGLI